MNHFLRPSLNLNANINFGGKGNGSNSSSHNNNNNNPNAKNSNAGKPSNGGSKFDPPKRSGRPHKNASSYKPFVGPSNPKVSSVEFSTNIPSGTLVNQYQPSSKSDHCTLFLLSGSLFPELNEGSTIVKELLLGDIYNRYLTSALMVHQRNKNIFSEENFLKYLSSLIDALSMFYSIESVLAYTLDPNNRNTGMLHIRSTFDADILSQHEILKNELVTYPIPRKLLGFVNFMYQNFTFSDTPNSPIYKLELAHIFRGSSSSPNGDSTREIIDRLRDCNEIVAIIKRAYPELIINELPASSPQPIYSKEFRTFWYNSCNAYYNKDSDSIHYTRKVADSTDNAYYAHFCNDDIDGIFYACCSHYNKDNDNIEPGIWKPYVNPFINDDLDINLSGTIVAYDSELRGFRMPSDIRTASQSGAFHGYYINSSLKPDSAVLIDPSA
jgi:hypothetical protein